MQERKFEELEDRASFAEHADSLKQLEARARVAKEIEAMKRSGEAIELSEEELAMVNSFRRFKLRMRRHGEVFKWQTRIPEGVQLAAETGSIVHPQEVVARDAIAGLPVRTDAAMTVGEVRLHRDATNAIAGEQPGRGVK